MRFTYDLQIKEHHIDLLGHVNHATYLQLFEEARWELLAETDFSLKNMHNVKLGPVILELTIQYRKEVFLREKIRIETLAGSFQGKVGELEQEMFNEKREVCCHVKMKYGLFDLSQRKLVTPTTEWLQAIKPRSP
jgi:thioesterase-3